jgi:hypothetical protein
MSIKELQNEKANESTTERTCSRCGTPISDDGEGEYRDRVILEDFARSSGANLETKLCHPCWRAVFAFATGDRE